MCSECIHLFPLLYSYFTRTFLDVCVCRLTVRRESVQQGEGLRRDGAWEHAVLQQRAAGEAPLDEVARVFLLIHVGVVPVSFY